ncbi:hypothetical protein [Catenuloplanes nepalensis]|nr:hypothetical protein [Catenuloplanes nepalensis]
MTRVASAGEYRQLLEDKLQWELHVLRMRDQYGGKVRGVGS